MTKFREKIFRFLGLNGKKKRKGKSSGLLVLFLLVPMGIGWVSVTRTPLSRDGDLWMHLKVGQLWAQRIFNATPLAPLTFTESARAETHSWLGQVFFFAAHRLAGPAALGWLHLFLLSAVLALVAAWIFRRTEGNLPLVGIGLVLTLCLHHQWADLKPALFGEFFFVWLALGIFSERDAFSWRRTAIGFLWIALWANLHGSAVIALPLAACLSLFLLMDGQANKMDRPLICTLGLFCQPKGLFIFSESWKLAREASRLGVTEWQRLIWSGDTQRGLFHLQPVNAIRFLVAFGLGLMVYALWKKRSPEMAWRFLLAGFLLVASVLSLRNSIYLSVAVSLGLVTFYEVFYPMRATIRPWIRLTGATAVAALFLWWGNPVSAQAPLVLPERAAAFMTEAGLEGKIFNHQAWGGFLEATLPPTLKVAWDGRLLPHLRAATAVRESESNGAADLGKIMEALPEADMVLAPSSIRVREGLGNNWLVIFENNRTTLALRRSPANAENLQRVESFFRSRGIPFDAALGFSLAKVYEFSPQWIARFEETPLQLEGARYASREWQDGQKVEDVLFYQSRGLRQLASERMELALEKK